MTKLVVELIKLGLHDKICLTNSFVFTPGHCMNFKEMRYESESLNRVLADKSLWIRLVLDGVLCLADSFELTIYNCTRLKAFRHE